MRRSRRPQMLAVGPILAAVVVSSLVGCTRDTSPPQPYSTRPTVDAALIAALTLTERHDPVDEVLRQVYGGLLATVSVETTGLGYTDDGGDEYPGQLVQYKLVDCPTLASTILPRDTETGFIPPITKGDPIPNVDRMSAERFRVLLRAYGQASTRPFGALRRGDGVYYAGLVATISRRQHSVSDLWVVTPGVLTAREYRAMYRDTDSVGPPAYVFSYPEGGAPEFLGVIEGAGENESPMD